MKFKNLFYILLTIVVKSEMGVVHISFPVEWYLGYKDIRPISRSEFMHREIRRKEIISKRLRLGGIMFM